jgi:hypothetical protein
MIKDGMPSEGWRDWPATLLDGVLAVETGAAPRIAFADMHAKLCKLVMPADKGN